MSEFTEELEQIVDKYVKNPPKPSDEVVDVVNNFIKQFNGSPAAIALCLCALGNMTKRIAILCKETDNELKFQEIMSDPIVKMMNPFVNQIMTCKRFK